MTASRIVITAFVGLWSISALAQVSPSTNSPNGPDQQGQIPNDPNAAKGGAQATVPDGQVPPSGPDIVDDPNATPEQKASAEYSGPAVLSRAISASEPMNPKNVKFTPSVGVEYVYSSGLTGVSPQAGGELSNNTASGVQLTYGVAGTKIYKKDMVSVSFGGSLYHYINASQFDGSNDSLSTTWRHELTRHLSFGIRVSASEFNQNNLLLSGAQNINSGAGTTLVTAAPATEAFDGRVFTFMTDGNVTYKLNARVSIDLSGGGFLTRRESTSLFGDTGYQAGGDLAYRITRLVTTGVYYSYTHFDFIGTYGGTNVNTVGLNYSIAFNPRTELVTRIGASRADTIGLSDVAVNPLFAILFGTSSAQEAIKAINYSPDFNLQLRHTVTNLTATLSYERGITPGNGVILTSSRQTGNFGLNYKFKRSWNVGSNAGYDSLSSFGVTNQKYQSVYAGISVYRTIMKNVSWHSRMDFHHYLFDNTSFLRNSFIMSTGVVWTPGDVLERVW